MLHLNRLIDLSIYYYLQGLLPSRVTVVDGYPVGCTGIPEDKLIIPSVAVLRLLTGTEPFELGGADLPYLAYLLAVYAETKTQRDEIAGIIQNDLKGHNIPVYDYNISIPSSTLTGTFVIQGKVNSRPMFIFPKIIEKLYWREDVTFSGSFSAK